METPELPPWGRAAAFRSLVSRLATCEKSNRSLGRLWNRIFFTIRAFGVIFGCTALLVNILPAGAGRAPLIDHSWSTVFAVLGLACYFAIRELHFTRMANTHYSRSDQAQFLLLKATEYDPNAITPDELKALRESYVAMIATTAIEFFENNSLFGLPISLTDHQNAYVRERLGLNGRSHKNSRKKRGGGA